MTSSRQAPLEITVKEAQRAQQQGVALVDIRTAEELRTGAPEGAVTMSAQDVLTRAAAEPGWHCNILCAGGARSLVLAARLRSLGSGSARSVAGGFERWMAAGLPVHATSSLRPEQNERYARHLVMEQVGVEGQKKLLESRVLLVGLGGLNSPAALYLAAAGLGTLGLLDDDRVERSNLQRQVLHGEQSVGLAKAQSARQRLSDLNPEVRTEVIEQRLDAANAAFLVSDWDIIIDGTDNFPARYALNQACFEAEKPLVYGAVMRFQGQVSVFWPASDPGRAPCLHCLLPEAISEKDAPSCAQAGVLGVIPGIVGTLQATEAIKLLLGLGNPLVGELLMIDALTMDFRKTKIHSSADCPVCG